jgi:hypothetical protein
LKSAEIHKELQRLTTDALTGHGFRSGGFKRVRLAWRLDLAPEVEGLIAYATVAVLGRVDVQPIVHVRHGAISRRIDAATGSRDPTSALAVGIATLARNPTAVVVDWEFMGAPSQLGKPERLVGGRRTLAEGEIVRARTESAHAVVRDMTASIVEIGVPYMRQHVTLSAIRDRHLTTDHLHCSAAEFVWPALLLEMGDVAAARTFVEDWVRRFNMRPDSSYATFARNLLTQAPSA